MVTKMTREAYSSGGVNKCLRAQGNSPFRREAVCSVKDQGWETSKTFAYKIRLFKTAYLLRRLNYDKSNCLRRLLFDYYW